jgi:type IV pilus assembly protein PilA
LVNAQSAPAQNARQALLEMLFGKPGSFERHLPKTTIAAITKASNGGPSMLGQFSMLSTFANAPGSHLQTFEAGSTLLSFSDDRTQSKFEVTVESDDLRGDEDEIQLSFQGSKDGQPVARPLMPTLSLLMKQEAGIWKLNTISLTMRFPLADPEFLKAMATMSQQRATGIGAIAQPSAGPGTSVQSRPMEASAIASLRAIVTAETTYANTYPARGFTCTLSDLDGFGADSPNEHQAMLIESRLASGKKAGYIFQLSGCTGSPSAHFQVTAVPATPGMGARAFCADQSAILRSSTDGLAASCTTNGTPLQ